MQIDLDTLKQRVLETVKQSTVGPRVENIVLEQDHDDEGIDFLRVVVLVKSMDKEKASDFEELLEAIEEKISTVDDRYPSVRFSDAA